MYGNRLMNEILKRYWNKNIREHFTYEDERIVTHITFETPLETFSVVLSSNYFFNNLNFIIFTSLFFILALFIICFQNDLNIHKNFFVFVLFKTFFSTFISLFKSLISSLRLQRFFILIIAVFLFILFTNLSGFFLLELSLTSHAIITLFLSFSLFINYFISELIVKFELIYEKFVIKNLEVYLLVPLFIIELVSYFVRPFSLGIRLFANILSGHILIHIFFGALLVFYKIFFWISVFLMLAVLFILLLEIFVSFIQSYIFLILSLIYLSEVT